MWGHKTNAMLDAQAVLGREGRWPEFTDDWSLHRGGVNPGDLEAEAVRRSTKLASGDHEVAAALTSMILDRWLVQRDAVLASAGKSAAELQRAVREAGTLIERDWAEAFRGLRATPASTAGGSCAAPGAGAAGQGEAPTLEVGPGPYHGQHLRAQVFIGYVEPKAVEVLAQNRGGPTVGDDEDDGDDDVPEVGDTCWLRGWARGPFLAAAERENKLVLTNPDGTCPEGRWHADEYGRWLVDPLALTTLDPPFGRDPRRAPLLPVALATDRHRAVLVALVVICAAAAIAVAVIQGGVALQMRRMDDPLRGLNLERPR